MGCLHSTPTLTDDVFLIPQSPLCSNYLSSSFNMKKQYEFVTPKNCWSLKGRTNNDKKSTNVSIEGCNLIFEPLDKNRCIVKEKSNNGGSIVIAILKSGVRQVTIYSFDPVTGVKNNDSQYKTDQHQQQQQLQQDGRPIYEWAVAKRHSKNGTVTSQYELSVKNTRSSNTSTLVTGNFGKVFSSLRHLVLKSQTLTVCATVEEETNLTSWKCRTCPGIDPVMIACFVVSLDKIKEMFEEELKNNYHDVMVQREFAVVA